ncbi:MAG: DUF2269 family protein [Gemmatimonadota bacterium]
MKRSDEETARLTREVTSRAIRRLDVLEWVIFAGAAALAVLGGALLALLVAAPLGFGFRSTWLMASLVLFIVPGAIAVTSLRRDERRRAQRLEQLREERDRET